MLNSGWLKQCEKFDLKKRRWTSLPDMREARCYFNPCMFNGYVYLCGALLVEAFDPHTNSFATLQLPQLSELYSYCTVYVHNNLLVVHSAFYISKFAAEQETQLVQHCQVTARTTICKHSSSQPVLDTARGLFFIIQENKCLSFNMETGAEIS